MLGSPAIALDRRAALGLATLTLLLLAVVAALLVGATPRPPLGANGAIAYVFQGADRGGGGAVVPAAPAPAAPAIYSEQAPTPAPEIAPAEVVPSGYPETGLGGAAALAHDAAEMARGNIVPLAGLAVFLLCIAAVIGGRRQRINGWI